MKYLLTYVAFIFFVIINCSCKHSRNDKFELVSSGKIIKINLFKQTKAFSNCVKYFEDKNGTQYLSWSNNYLNRIEFYDISTGELSKIVQLEKEGPNGIIGLSGYQIISFDSILVFNSGESYGEFYLINNKGGIINKYKIQSPIKDFICSPVVPSSVLKNDILIDNDTALIPFSTIFYLENPETIKNIMVMAKLCLSDGTYTFLNYHHPILKNTKGELVSSQFSIEQDTGTNYILSYISSHSMFYYRNGITVEINAKSKFISNDFISNSSKDNFDLKKIISLPYYTSFYKDDKNKTYYRFVRLGDEYDNKREFFVQNRYPKNFSIIIFDKNFNIIGETKMPKDKYCFSMSFMTEEGLYICASNINSPDFSEDYVVFELFSLKNKN